MERIVDNVAVLLLSQDPDRDVSSESTYHWLSFATR